ncbi:HPF/RaiA family ribosome-associated protein [Pedobacter frigidisoli]|uniref:HPF/RaiA family ribosome-associated protein n=1 Tax=Pedobacter frigidisoli TaxID=2530455 RepID=A0A4R0NGM2_9SPHI|nr:HPF/RaiA family ribosome-associated protein [Pedobacter frigidisoli]TCC98897.1 HPF/RaiA family ribosome-associated protein [Pedobacter frigidisoli]
MTIQLNTDKNLTIHQEYEDKINTQITEALSRFSYLITRLEVHLSDENGSKDGLEDKRCLLEVRITGKEPIAVTNLGNTYDLAITGALTKLKSKLETVAGKMKAH